MYLFGLLNIYTHWVLLPLCLPVFCSVFPWGDPELQFHVYAVGTMGFTMFLLPHQPEALELFSMW
jgi:hypothetical protein